MAINLEERVDQLETIFGKFISQTGAAILRLERSDQTLKNEMSDFKNEMRDFKNEMLDFKNEMLDFKNEMLDFKNEMLDFKNEMRDFKNEMRSEVKRMNKQWGELSNKMGTMVEDLIYPSIERIIQKQFDVLPDSLAIRLRKRLPDGREKEFDAVAIAGDIVYLNSTKSTLKSKDIDDFIKEIQVFKEFFPEHRNKKIVGILASLTIDKSVLTYAEKNGFLVLGVGDEIMEVKNSKDFQPKFW